MQDLTDESMGYQWALSFATVPIGSNRMGHPPCAGLSERAMLLCPTDNIVERSENMETAFEIYRTNLCVHKLLKEAYGPSIGRFF